MSCADPSGKSALPVPPLPLSEDDALEAMKELHGYFDLTPHDFRELSAMAYSAAFSRLLRQRAALGVMTAPARDVGAADGIGVLIALLAEASISGVPVLDARRKLAGVVS